MDKCAKQGHRYEKFDERSIFCERCGDQKFLTAAVGYWPRPYWYYYPSTTPWPYPSYPFIVSSSSSTGTVSIGSTVTDWNGEQLSFTVSDGSQSDA